MSIITGQSDTFTRYSLKSLKTALPPHLHAINRQNNLHTLNHIMEKSIEFHTPIYLAFVDYSKAFDSRQYCEFYIPLQPRC